MIKIIQIIPILLFIYSCSSETKKELSEKEKKVIKYEYADIILMDQKEKIILLSTIKNVPYDTLYLILKDYYTAISDVTFYNDSCVSICNNTINTISKNYQLPKSKIVSIIFSFKYEMQTKQDIIDDNYIENQDQQEDYQEDNQDESRY